MVAIAAAVAAVIVAVAMNVVGLRIARTPSAADNLARLTSDPGLQINPTLSADGSSVAYTSNKAGNFDIWMQPVSGGKPIPVTNDPAHDWQPDWSPKGDLIVFRSERAGGGLLTVPYTGGQERKILSFGYRPRWSPDGTRILFVGISGSTEWIYTVGWDDAPPVQIDTTYLRGQHFVETALTWHPDGRHISLLRAEAGAMQLVTLPTTGGGQPVPSDVSDEGPQGSS